MPSQQEILKTSGRIPELDGLRGVAILLVISFHYINNQLVHSPNKLGLIVSKLTSFGWVGVDLFFVLSGFLIGSILIRNKKSKKYFSTFYLRRLVRIVPNYYFLIVVFIIILSIPWFAGNYFLSGNNVIPTWSYFTMVHNFYMAYFKNFGNTAMSVTWSIGIEEQFYIIFPFIVYFIKDQWLPFILIAAIIMASFIRATYQNWVPQYVLLPCRMDAISFGALVAWINYHYDLKALTKKYFLPFIVIIAADIIICAYLFVKYNDLGAVKNSLFALVFAILLIFSLTYADSWYGRFLRNKILVWIGAISYSLYLFHYLILGIFHHLTGNKTGIGIYNINDLVISVIALIVSILFSWLVFKVLETPLVNWGKRFKY
jgi:peptidoglycan/LPS O-acetylase OafA/YrhL